MNNISTTCEEVIFSGLMKPLNLAVQKSRSLPHLHLDDDYFLKVLIFSIKPGFVANFNESPIAYQQGSQTNH